MNSKTTEQFRRLLADLPQHVQKQARDAYRLFRANPSHPSLRFKPVTANGSIYSARIGMGYRALGVRNRDRIVWFWIGTHGEYDKLVARL
ncbi:MAG TPA: hypothetical protein VF116_06880 [Ktedonobacterales bacterium]